MEQRNDKPDDTDAAWEEKKRPVYDNRIALCNGGR